MHPMDETIRVLLLVVMVYGTEESCGLIVSQPSLSIYTLLTCPHGKHYEEWH
jgi:hypothetical protein